MPQVVTAFQEAINHLETSERNKVGLEVLEEVKLR